VVAASGEFCEVIDSMTLGICATQFVIRDSAGNVNDVMGLFDSRARHLEAVDTFSKDVTALQHTHSAHSKLDAEQETRVKSIVDRANGVALMFGTLDYDASLKQADELLAKLSR